MDPITGDRLGLPAGNQATVGQDLIERALVACLAALADLANDIGQPARADRLREAVQALRASSCSNPSHTDGSGVSANLSAMLSRPIAHSPSCPLTAHEHDVASLIGHGLTNRQIAARLVISERTADTHVQNILGKLGLASRAQVAIWFVQHSLGSRAAPGHGSGDMVGHVPTRLVGSVAATSRSRPVRTS